MKWNNNIMSMLLLLILSGLLLFPFLPILTISFKVLTHREQIQKRLNKTDHLDTIELDAAVFASYNDKHEFTFQGNKYDVYQVNSISAQRVQIIAFKDNIEDLMLIEVICLFTKDNDGKNIIKLITSPDWTFEKIEKLSQIFVYSQRSEFEYKDKLELIRVKNFPHPPSTLS